MREKGIITQAGTDFNKYHFGKLIYTPHEPTKREKEYSRWLYGISKRRSKLCYLCASPLIEKTHIKLFLNKIYSCSSKGCLHYEKPNSLWPVWVRSRVFKKQDIEKAMRLGHLSQENLQYLKGEIIS